MLDYVTKAFPELSLTEFYAIMVLRQEVFVVEQDCPYLDCDGKDQPALHLMGWDAAGRLGAYARLLDRGVSYPEYASIGRVIVAASQRGTGEGYRLMQEAAQQLFNRFGPQTIKISAQAHLQDFYGRLGYEGVGEEYLEDDIPHRAMIREI